jgi:tight adherence protein B
MGALVGLGFGIGLLLIWTGLSRVEAPSRPPDRTRRRRLRDLLAQAGVEGVSPVALVLSSITTGLVVLAATMIFTRSIAIAFAFALAAAYAPIGLVRRRASKRREELREIWPDAVDHISSAIRAGLSLPESLAQLGVRGPEKLRRPFQRFGEDYRLTGRFDECLDRLKESLADPVGDRVVEAIRMARQVGGSELGRLLRTLSGFLRADARTRDEIEARQSWTINAARLAVASPWLVLAFLSLRPETVARYDSRAGVVVLTVGAVVCIVAYRVMIRIARLPPEERVLR